ncbi:hypothetical protein [Rubrivirga marina]|uniref:DUF4270 domain-containing protein n=1 Tax=Rubrivirga marina TaxID=1196024 RepID=A0A271J1A0_9BACT|nr:hypothetical protein [Rubrivirga marina]PAP77286.1 hypothetical protein BSZ37_13000 [Rubrivirga marina]
MRFTVAAAAAVLLLSACQDPAGVGLGLIDEEQLDPNVRTVPVTTYTEVPDTTVAIGIASTSTTTAIQTRVLAGRVVDPVFGDARAVAYVDLLQPSTLDGDAEAGDVTDAWLELDRAYAYGDTTTALPLELREIQGSWEVDTSYPADTLFATGDVLSTTTVVASDTLRRFDLPDAWVSANAALLLSDDFDDDFEGFALDVPASFVAAPGVVFGFNTFASEGSGLRVVVGEDTVRFPLSEVFSSIATEAPTMVPSGTLGVRASPGAAVRFDADFSPIGSTPLARARIRLPLDASLARDGAFVRPIASRSFLYGIRTVDGEEELVRLSDSVVYDGSGELTVVATTGLTQQVQALLLDPAQAFERYELRSVTGIPSLDIFPLLLPESQPDPGPRFTLTLVGSAPE